MTSLLRRKRQITARNTPTPRVGNSPDVTQCTKITIFAIVCLSAVFILAPDVFADSQSDVQTVSYSTGEQLGVKLTWHPQRPTKQQVNRSLVGPRLAKLETRVALKPVDKPKDNAFANPFGDSKSSPKVPAKSPSFKAPGKLPSFKTDTPKKPVWKTDLFKADELKTPALKKENVDTKQYAPNLSPKKLKAEELKTKTLPNSDTAKELEVKPMKLTPSLERELAAVTPNFEETCPKLTDLKPITDISTSLEMEKGELPRECPMVPTTYDPRHWAPTTFTWKASGLCHKPLYFEDVHLERYGHSCGPYAQPFVSGARFFLTVPIMPYLIGVNPTNECIYTLGYYRPGNCAPYMLDPLPISVRGALFQAGAVTGLAAIIP